ncbi:MAG: hypothetical protein NDF56_05235 [archaeon GB-1845-036]|nr:hypothetical protein [Candidatus Culexmicrobium thermophilum]
MMIANLLCIFPYSNGNYYDYIPISINGYLNDFYSSLPICDAEIKVFASKYYSLELVGEGKSNVEGFYNVYFTFPSWKLPSTFIILIFHKDASNNTFTHVPILNFISIDKKESPLIVQLNFTIFPAATIRFVGQFIHVNFSDPASKLSFRILVDENYPLKDCSILKFGEVEDYVLDQLLNVMGISKNQVIVPAGYPFNILVTGYFVERFEVPWGIAWYVHRTIIQTRYVTFSIPAFNSNILLKCGTNLELPVLNVTANDSLKTLEKLYSQVSRAVERASSEGFYTTSLNIQIGKVHNLIDEAGLLISQGKFVNALSLLRESYITLLNVSSYLKWLYKEVSLSVNLLLIFFLFGSLFMAYILSEKLLSKSILSAIFYSIFLAILSLSYPMAPKFNLNIIWFIISPSLIIIFIGLLSNFLSRFKSLSKLYNISDLLSLSKRNLRRRKIRTLALFTSFLLFTAGSIALTSTSFDINLLSSSKDNSLGIKGISMERNVPSQFIIDCYGPLEAENNPYGQPIPSIILDILNSSGNVHKISFRAETHARVVEKRDYGKLFSLKNRNKFAKIGGIVSFSSTDDPIYLQLLNCLISGSMPTNDNDIVVSGKLADYLNVNVGDEVLFHGRRFKISGILDDWKVEHMYELSGRPLLPYKLFLSLKGEDGNPDIYESTVCDAAEVIFVSWSAAMSLKLYPTRVFAFLSFSDEDLVSLGKMIAMRGGNILVTVYTSSKIYQFLLSKQFSFSGWAALIPIGIIMLNAAISSAASLYERRRESIILSAVGGSPSKLLTIFLSESMLLGFSAGSTGYIFGLSLYRLMAITSNIDVRPKVSFIWVLLSLLVSIFGATFGSLLTLRSSIIIVPSKLWRIKGRRESSPIGELLVFDIPVKILMQDVQEFFNFLVSNLKSFPSTLEEHLRVVEIRRGTLEIGSTYSLVFTYDSGVGSTSRNISRCFLEISVDKPTCNVSLKIKSYGADPEKHALYVARIIRSIAMKWR